MCSRTQFCDTDTRSGIEIKDEFHFHTSELSVPRAETVENCRRSMRTYDWQYLRAMFVLISPRVESSLELASARLYGDSMCTPPSFPPLQKGTPVRAIFEDPVQKVRFAGDDSGMIRSTVFDSYNRKQGFPSTRSPKLHVYPLGPALGNR